MCIRSRFSTGGTSEWCLHDQRRRKVSYGCESSFARERIWFLNWRMNAGRIDGIPLGKYIAPTACLLDAAKVRTHFHVVRMQLRVFDGEFSHVGQTSLRTVRFFGQTIVLADDVALLVKRRRIWQRLSGRERAGLRKNPRVADCTAGHRHAIDARVANHVETRLGIEQVAAAKHDPVACNLFELPQKLPPRRAVVPLRHSSSVNRNRRNAKAKRALENLEKLLAAFRRVVDSAPHLDRDRNLPPAPRRAPGEQFRVQPAGWLK